MSKTQSSNPDHDDDIVLVPARGRTDKVWHHPDPDDTTQTKCGHGGRVYPKPRSVIDGDRKECAYCADTESDPVTCEDCGKELGSEIAHKQHRTEKHVGTVHERLAALDADELTVGGGC